MRKLSTLLKWLILSFIFILSVEFILLCRRISMILFTSANPPKKILSIDFTEHLPDSTFSIIGFITSLVFIYLLYHLVRFFSAVNEFSDKEIFTDKNISWLNSAGRAIFLVTFLMIFIDLSHALHLLGEKVGHAFSNNLESSKSLQIPNNTTSYQIGYGIGYFTGILYNWIPLLILGVLIRIVSELVKKGSFIKQENDLTI